jgi:hypothetical protein
MLLIFYRFDRAFEHLRHHGSMEVLETVLYIHDVPMSPT